VPRSKNKRSHTSTPQITPSWRGAQLKHRDNFTFTFAWDAHIYLRNKLRSILGLFCWICS